MAQIETGPTIKQRISFLKPEDMNYPQKLVQLGSACYVVTNPPFQIRMIKTE